MCGIIGFAGDVPEGRWGETHAVLEELLLLSETRGRDATGFAALASPRQKPQDGDVLWDKLAVQSKDFVRSSSPWRLLGHRRCSMLIGHVRLATSGSPADRANNHPHAGRRGLYLVHNGIVAGHRGIARSSRLRLDSQCDSEILLRLIESAPDPARGLAGCLRVCDDTGSSMAVAVLDAPRERVWLARNRGRPLWVARLRQDPRWWFASTDTILTQALKNTLDVRLSDLELLLPLADGVVHALSPAGLVAM